MSQEPKDRPPPPPGAAPSAASDGVIKVLAALTILALIAQGLVMLHSQVTYLSSLKPKHTRPSEASHDTASRPSHVDLHSRDGRFTQAFKKYKAPQPDRGSGGGGGEGSERSKDGIIETYRKHYNEQGIRDEEFIIVMALEHADNAYTGAMVAAAKAMENNGFEAARDAIKQALTSIDERHLLARMRLLQELSNIEFRAADPEAGRAAQRDADEIKIEVAKIYVKAMSEKREGGISTQQADQILSQLSDDRELHDNVSKVSSIFSGQGEDPEKAPQRIMALFKMIQDAPDTPADRAQEGRM